MPTKKWLEEHKEYMKEYHKKYNKTHKERLTKNKQRIKTWFAEFKLNLKCKNCSESNSECLDFHHRNPQNKEFEISLGIRMGYGIEKLKKEIEKCDVLCVNCHKKLHAKEKPLISKNRKKNYKIRLRHWMDKFKDKCKFCNETNIICLEFHHREQHEKEFTLAQAHIKFGKEKIEKEINKCDIVCGNCHRKIHKKPYV